MAVYHEATPSDCRLKRIRHAWDCYDHAVWSRNTLNRCGAVLQLYDLHGSPFGLTMNALQVWMRYRQSTTPN